MNGNYYQQLSQNGTKRLFGHWLALFALFCGFSLLLQSCGGTQEPANAVQPHAAANTPRVLKVSDTVIKKIDLRHEMVKRAPLAVPLHVTGRIEPEVGKEVDVTTRISGRVTSVLVQPGQMVNRGQILAALDSQEITDLQAELIEALSKLNIALAHEERERQIYEEQLQRPKGLITARTNFNSCAVQRDLAKSEFDRQQGLYKEKISSQRAFLEAQAALAKAEAEYEEALTDYQREERLYKNKAAMKRDYQLAQAETARERQHVKTLEQRLEFLGMDPRMGEEIIKTGHVAGIVRITAPVSGVISHHEVAVGEVIQPEKAVFRITDLNTVLVKADLPEVDLTRVRIGSKVRIKVASYPDQVFEGAINYISEHVNQETRTVAIRARLNNPGRKLKTNMFAEIDIAGEPKMLLACPKSAVQEHDGKKIVFVLTPAGYEERHITTGSESEESFEIIAGLKEGEQVATQGSLMLKTELSYGHKS